VEIRIELRNADYDRAGAHGTSRDLLKPALESSWFATLAMVSTGESLRKWLYYVRSEAKFLGKLNAAIGREPRFPIEIHVAEDAKWSTYEKFRSGINE
jgi:hypothetical protein